MGLAISALVETTDKATALVPLLLIPQVLFAGVFTPLTGLSGAVGNVMPTRWSYDLLKRVVIRTNRDLEPPLIDFAAKAKAESELAAIESHTHAILAEIDGKAAVASAACARADVTRREMNDSLAHMGEHEKALVASYDRSRTDLAAIESQTEAIGKALERERKAARSIQNDLATLSGSTPEAARALLTPEWAAERRARLEEAANAYGEVEQSVAAIEVSKKSLIHERSELEGRGKDARRIEGDLREKKEQLEKEGAVLVAAAEAIHDLEGALKADASRVKEIQAEVTTNLRQRRYVQLLARDSVELDAAVLGAFCLFLGVVTLGLQRLRDGEA
jgi:hypothetical protein